MNGPYFGPCTTIRQYRDRDQDRQNDADAELEAVREADSFSFGLKRELTNTRFYVATNQGALMDNQHQKIKGYRDLSQAEIDLMNEIKSHAEKTRELLDKVGSVMAREADELQVKGQDEIVAGALSLGEARRWLALGKTQLQQGFMAVTRAVARPTSF